MRTEFQQKLEAQPTPNRHSGPRIMRGGAAQHGDGAGAPPASMRGGGAKLALTAPGAAPAAKGGQGSGLLSRLLGGKDK
jgi:hypothetical protein